MTPTSKFLAPAIAALLLGLPALASAQTVEGMIISHQGNKLVVRTGGAGGVDTPVMLTDTTKVEAVIGLVGARRETRQKTDLINGLAVNIETAVNGTELDAVTVTFKPGDLKTAQAVQAGTDQAKQRITAAQAENDRRLSDSERRLSQVGQFDTKASTRVFFATGKATIDDEGKQELHKIADQAKADPAILVRVVGHADKTGNAAANQRLSDQRASAVTAYLVRECAVPTTKIMSAGGLGSAVAAEDDDSSASLAQSRRVTVSLMVAKASQSTPAPAATTP
jgi:outer membrane protein OmpA-like peptidoglycan-associated protein